MVRPPEICPIHCLLKDGTRKTACMVVMEGPTLALPRFGEAGLGPLGWLGLAPWGLSGALMVERWPLPFASGLCTLCSLLPSFRAWRRVLGSSLHLGDPWQQQRECPSFHLLCLRGIYLCLLPPSPPTLNNVSSQKHFQEPVVSTNPGVFRLLYTCLHVSMAVSVVLLCSMSEFLSGKREGLQDNATWRKGGLLLTRVRAPATSNAVVWGPRAPSPSCYTNL